MANTFTLQSKTYDGRYMKLTCTQTKNISANTSTITWKLETIGGSVNYYTTGATTLTINGTQAYYKARTSAHSFPCAKGSASGTVTVPHNNDGTKSIAVSFSTAIYTKTISTYSNTWELDANPRGATISSAPNITDITETFTVTYSNPAGTSANTLRLYLSKDNLNTHYAYWDLPKNASSATLNLTDAIREDLRTSSIDLWAEAKFPVYFAIETIIGTYSDWKSLTKECEIVNCNPVMNLTAQDTNEKTLALTGNPNKIIAGYNTLECYLEAYGTKGAEVISRYIELEDGRNSTQSAATFENVTLSTITYAARDNRNVRVEQTHTLDMIHYNPVYCTYSASTAMVGETTAKATIEISGSFFSGSFGAQDNSLTIAINYNGNTGYATPTIGDYGKFTAIFEAEFLYTDNFTFTITASDKLSTMETAEYTLKVIPVFDWSGEDFNFNVPVSIGGVELDYIVEQGTKNSWYYRKWNSGIMECWRRIQITTAVTNTWGNMYVSGAISATNLTYPFGFTEQPILNVNLASFGSGGLIMASGSNYGSATTTGVFEIARGTSSASAQFLLNYHAIGKYK